MAIHAIVTYRNRKGEEITREERHDDITSTSKLRSDILDTVRKEEGNVGLNSTSIILEFPNDKITKIMRTKK
ncbi:MAG: hypothetical protein M1360_03610 [Candidatus Marsarchaeota archaeon]|nr:hypothetical protein [Candidatus Marsarchaeota archaeon]MCL5418999.1 hypothetical protein [Candidatus Marsarchaeota archaeon]